ncbi:MAG: hypothetical protein AAGF96_18070 [Bacteroidota bacterium]
MKKEPEIRTVVELERWLKDNCYVMDRYSINGNAIFEGYGLENNGGLFQWFYTERGNKETLEHFATEKDAVQFALKKIRADEYANRNYIGMYTSDSEVGQLLSELKKRGIAYWTDKIPFGGVDDVRTRIFVIGCDIKKATDLKQQTT